MKDMNRELRLGNYVMDRGGKVIRIDFFEHLEADHDCKFGQKVFIGDQEVHPLTEYTSHAKPIPLTPDQLPKLGFSLSKRKSGTQGVYSNGKMNVILSNSFNVYTTKNKLIPYVHTLQNVYYFHLLTGEELTYKP